MTFVNDSDVCDVRIHFRVVGVFTPLESRIRLLKDLKFDQFYKSVVKGVVGLPGDYKTHMNTILKALHDTGKRLWHIIQAVEVAHDIFRNLAWDADHEIVYGMENVRRMV